MVELVVRSVEVMRIVLVPSVDLAFVNLNLTINYKHVIMNMNLTLDLYKIELDLMTSLPW